MLQSRIDNIDLLNTIEDYNDLLRACSDQREMAATVFVYDSLLKSNIIPNEETFKQLERLHSKTLKETKTILLPPAIGKTLQARRRIHKIIKGHKYSDLYAIAKEYLPAARILTQEIAMSKPLLIKTLTESLGVDQKMARLIITALKRNKN